MNAKQIRTMLQNILADCGGNELDTIVIDTIMRVYYTDKYIDWEECKLLFLEYLADGILDFPKAKRHALLRVIREEA